MWSTRRLRSESSAARRTRSGANSLVHSFVVSQMSPRSTPESAIARPTSSSFS